MRITDFVSLPASVQTAIYILTCTSILGVVAAMDPKLALIVGLGIVALALAIGAFILISRAIRKRRASSMTQDLSRSSSNAPMGVDQQRIDNIRRAFLDGLSKFGSAENIYKFPWYVIVGEPGGGKTEAIRHCGVGFPPGLHEKGTEMLGAGGTVNMNWWFTNHAVFLDTAGRLMFEDVRPGENNEWREFLQLLNRNRPNCPINGLLLVIPADVLINDTEAELDRKANKIAQQFEVIQRTLDVRFPVFVVITKSDLLSGFREFFDDFNDSQSTNQMLGWSNPADRDTPFAPDRVTDHLATVVERIKRRRLSILRDPVPRTEARRVDEVDALYSLPQSIQLIAPRLRQYLEKIFVAGPWSPKPLFLRGIYFTSSMREGSALDQELALALGMRTQELPEGKVWVKERAYFLRDIFSEKIFRESGLVTRATNTRKMLRKRSLILWGTSSVLALAFIGFTLYAYRQFADSIKRHSDLWTTARSPDDWKLREGQWQPIVSADKAGDTVAKFRGTQPPIKVGNNAMPLLTYHDRLRDVSQQKIETGWVYSPMEKLAKLGPEKLKAQRIVFEASAIYPLVESARLRMTSEPIATAVDAGEGNDVRFDREAQALAALLRIEADRVTGQKNIEQLPDAVLFPLLRYATASRTPGDEEALNSYRATFLQTYGKNPHGQWVPERLAKGSESLPSNAPIQAGLGRLKALAGETVRGQLDSAAKIAELRDDLKNFRKVESNMESIATGLGDNNEKKTKLDTSLAQLLALKTAVDKRLRESCEAGLLDSSRPSMVAAYKHLVTDSQARSNGSFQMLREAVKPNLAHPTAHLFKEVDDDLAKAQEGLSRQVAQTFNEKEQEELASLDGYLDEYREEGTASRVYAGRYATYDKVGKLANTADGTGNLIGSGWAAYGTVQKSIASARDQVSQRQPRLSPERMRDIPSLTVPCDMLLKIAEERRLAALEQAYLRETIAAFQNSVFYPYVNVSASVKSLISDGSRYITKWQSDLASTEFLKSPVKTKLALFKEELVAMQRSAEEYRVAYQAYTSKQMEYETALAALKVTVELVSVEPMYVYHKIGGRDIFTKGVGGTFEADRKGLTLRAEDPVNQRYPNVVVDTSLPRNVPVTVGKGTNGEATFNFVVKYSGEVPKPPGRLDHKAPDKATILRKLQ